MASHGVFYIKIKGINFGLLHDKPDQLYAFQVYNPITNNKTKYYTFHYKNQRNFEMKFSIDVVNEKSQTFTIYLYKCHTLYKELLAELVVPLSAFEPNTVCMETCELRMKKNLQFPLSINFDAHLDLDGSNMFAAPPGRSQLSFFDIDAYRSRISMSNSFVEAKTPKGIKASASQPLVFAGYY